MHMHRQQGNILVSTLLILIVLNLLAIGIMQVSLRTSSSATFKTVNSEVLQVTDSCSTDAIIWLKSQTITPTTLPVFSSANLNFMFSGTETQSMLNKLSGYSYTCTLTALSGATADGSKSSGIGEEVGGSAGYGSSGNLSPKNYYKITATGGGPKNSAKTVNTIISVEF